MYTCILYKYIYIYTYICIRNIYTRDRVAPSVVAAAAGPACVCRTVRVCTPGRLSVAGKLSTCCIVVPAVCCAPVSFAVVVATEIHVPSLRLALALVRRLRTVCSLRAWKVRRTRAHARPFPPSPPVPRTRPSLAARRRDRRERVLSEWKNACNVFAAAATSPPADGDRPNNTWSQAHVHRETAAPTLLARTRARRRHDVRAREFEGYDLLNRVGNSKFVEKVVV